MLLRTLCRAANGVAGVKGGAAWLKKRIFGRASSSSRLGPGKRANSGGMESDDSDATPQSRSQSQVRRCCCCCRWR